MNFDRINWSNKTGYTISFYLHNFKEKSKIKYAYICRYLIPFNQTKTKAIITQLKSFIIIIKWNLQTWNFFLTFYVLLKKWISQFFTGSNFFYTKTFYFLLIKTMWNYLQQIANGLNSFKLLNTKNFVSWIRIFDIWLVFNFYTKYKSPHITYW